MTEALPTPDAATFSTERYSRAIEPDPSVTITDETFFGHGWQPLTIAVIQAIWFMPQGADFSVNDLVDWFRSLGWRSANGKPLGEDAVRRELALIRKAGYIHAARERGEGGRITGIRYEISKRPRRGEQGPVGFDRSKTDTSRSHHVPPMTTHGGSPHLADQASPQVAPRASNDHTWSMADVAEREKAQVAPCASNGAHPPHPPEEVETSSPYPHKTASAPKEEGEGSSAIKDKQRQAAYNFLQDLPDPWRAGRATAKKLAPELADAVEEQGWSLDMDLVRKLTEMPDGIKSYPSVLAKRIADLPRRGRACLPQQTRDRYSDVPEPPKDVVPAEDGMVAVRAALAAFRGNGLPD